METSKFVCAGASGGPSSTPSPSAATKRKMQNIEPEREKCKRISVTQIDTAAKYQESPLSSNIGNNLNDPSSNNGCSSQITARHDTAESTTMTPARAMANRQDELMDDQYGDEQEDFDEVPSAHWILAKGSKAARRENGATGSSTRVSSQGANTSNRFTTLEAEDTLQTTGKSNPSLVNFNNISNNKKPDGKSIITDNSNGCKSGATGERREAMTKQGKVPPIIAKNLNIKILNGFLENTEIEAKIVNYKSGISKIYTESLEERKLLFKVLQREKVDCFTYSAVTEKPISLLLKGVDISYDEKDVEEELGRLFSKEILLKVRRFETDKSRKENYILDSFLIQIKPGTNLEHILHTRKFLNQRITWDKVRSRGTIQCYRCQSFGHLAENCGRIPRCRRCAMVHSSRDCPLKENLEATRTCANCKQKGHPSNYRGCPSFINYMEKKKEKNNKVQPNKHDINARKSSAFGTNPRMSYRDAVISSMNMTVESGEGEISGARLGPREKTKTSLIPKGGLGEKFLGLSWDLFGTSLQDLLNKINDFMTSLNSIPSAFQKRQAYLLFIMDMCNGK